MTHTPIRRATAQEYKDTEVTARVLARLATYEFPVTPASDSVYRYRTVTGKLQVDFRCRYDAELKLYVLDSRVLTWNRELGVMTNCLSGLTNEYADNAEVIGVRFVNWLIQLEAVQGGTEDAPTPGLDNGINLQVN